MNYRIFSLFAFVLFTSFSNIPSSNNSLLITPSKKIEKPISMAASVYETMDKKEFSMPSFECFNQALEGFYKLKEKGLVERDVITLIDFTKSSNQKRLWVIDLENNVVLFNTLVAHGKNSGEEFANSFSNKSESFQSSLGFYITGEVYNGKHGMSLKLDGLEKGFNDNARNRAVVVHGADYVSESFIKNHNRLGRSQGCPAVPVEMNEKIINAIKGKSCLFIYHSSKKNSLI